MSVHCCSFIIIVWNILLDGFLYSDGRLYKAVNLNTISSNTLPYIYPLLGRGLHSDKCFLMIMIIIFNVGFQIEYKILSELHENWGCVTS